MQIYRCASDIKVQSFSLKLPNDVHRCTFMVQFHVKTVHNILSRLQRRTSIFAVQFGLCMNGDMHYGQTIRRRDATIGSFRGCENVQESRPRCRFLVVRAIAPPPRPSSPRAWSHRLCLKPTGRISQWQTSSCTAEMTRAQPVVDYLFIKLRDSKRLQQQQQQQLG